MEVSVAQQLNTILDEYANKVDRTIEHVTDRVAKETAQELKKTSPRDNGDYAGDWAVKKTGKFGKIVYNRRHYQLTHLLNNGHVVRNQYGTYGRTSGDGHITNAEENASRKIIDELRREL